MMSASHNTTPAMKFLHLLTNLQLPHTALAEWGSPFRDLLPVLLQYTDTETISKLMQTSRCVLQKIVETPKPFPLRLVLTKDICNHMLRAKSCLMNLREATRIQRFSLELCVNSNGERSHDALHLVQGLTLFIIPGHEDHVHTMIIQSLDLAEDESVTSSLARCISHLHGLISLDISGLHCHKASITRESIIDTHLVPELTALSRLESLKVNLRTLPVLRHLDTVNTGLEVLKIDGTPVGGEQSDIFRTLSQLRMTSLGELSCEKMAVSTGLQASTLDSFLRKQGTLSRLYLRLCNVRSPACDSMVKLLGNQSQLKGLELKTFHVEDGCYGRVCEQVEQMTGLESLTLDGSPYTPEQVETWCRSVCNMTRLTSLTLNYLTFSQTGVKELTAALRNIPRLRQLDLRNIRCPDTGMSDFATALTTLGN